MRNWILLQGVSGNIFRNCIREISCCRATDEVTSFLETSICHNSKFSLNSFINTYVVRCMLLSFVASSDCVDGVVRYDIRFVVHFIIGFYQPIPLILN